MSPDATLELTWHACMAAGAPYGEAWAAGDVIGCALDLDGGTVSFTRNGRDMGQAFTDIRRPLSYFPAISLSYGVPMQPAGSQRIAAASAPASATAW